MGGTTASTLLSITDTVGSIIFFFPIRCWISWSRLGSTQSYSRIMPQFGVRSNSHDFPFPRSWRLNDNLLRDGACLADVRRSITDFIAHHSSYTTSLPYKWEALKCVVRGILISHGYRLKKNRTGVISNLLSKIATLEMAYKRSLLESVRVQLTDARQELLRILDQNYLCMKVRRGFSEFGDKSGRWLARALHPRNATTHIMQLSSTS